MLLAVDVGNTETTVGLFAGESLAHHWRLTSTASRTGDELWVQLHALLSSEALPRTAITAMAVSAVVPALIPAYRRLGERLLGREPLMIDHRTIPGLRILNLDPASVGADRLVNAVAAAALYGKPAIVVDLGTATTLDVVGRGGEYAGGVIAPGILTAANALFERGARLAGVEVKLPERVVGRSTEESLQAGIFLGAVYAVDGLVRAIFQEQGFPVGTPVIATGGFASSIQAASKTITAVDPTLTLTGIRMVWEGTR